MKLTIQHGGCRANWQADFTGLLNDRRASLFPSHHKHHAEIDSTCPKPAVKFTGFAWRKPAQHRSSSPAPLLPLDCKRGNNLLGSFRHPRSRIVPCSGGAAAFAFMAVAIDAFFPFGRHLSGCSICSAKPRYSAVIRRYSFLNSLIVMAGGAARSRPPSAKCAPISPVSAMAPVSAIVRLSTGNRTKGTGGYSAPSTSHDHGAGAISAKPVHSTQYR